MMSGVFQIANREALEQRFGSWPSFHDAEVYAVRLNSGQRPIGHASVEMDIHVFAVDGARPDGYANDLNHTLVTFLFEGVEDLELAGFGPQNVLWELELEDLGADFVSASRIQVSLPSSNGLDGAFRCEKITVIAVEPFEPGAHSVYRTDR